MTFSFVFVLEHLQQQQQHQQYVRVHTRQKQTRPKDNPMFDTPRIPSSRDKQIPRLFWMVQLEGRWAGVQAGILGRWHLVHGHGRGPLFITMCTLDCSVV